MFKISLITADNDSFQYVKDIRTAVFVGEQGIDSNLEFDRFDKVAAPALFALLEDEGAAAATARLVLTEKGYKLGRVAVLKAFRGMGYGDAVVRTLLEKALSLGAEEVFVDAQNHAVPFYEKIGFKIVGGEITDRGLNHIQMSIRKGDVKTNCHCS